jgi:signal recognition particle subunit SRP54
MVSLLAPPSIDSPETKSASRRVRIAKGSARPVSEVNRLLKQFKEMQGFLKQMKGMMPGM